LDEKSGKKSIFCPLEQFFFHEKKILGENFPQSVSMDFPSATESFQNHPTSPEFVYQAETSLLTPSVPLCFTFLLNQKVVFAITIEPYIKI
jgi:hypothetical protein